jgi:hypothetical protein
VTPRDETVWAVNHRREGNAVWWSTPPKRMRSKSPISRARDETSAANDCSHAPRQAPPVALSLAHRTTSMRLARAITRYRLVRRKRAPGSRRARRSVVVLLESHGAATEVFWIALVKQERGGPGSALPRERSISRPRWDSLHARNVQGSEPNTFLRRSAIPRSVPRNHSLQGNAATVLALALVRARRNYSDVTFGSQNKQMDPTS